MWSHKLFYMWQSWVENIHYSVSMKIEFNTENNTTGHRLSGSRSLAPLRVHATSYRPQNTAHFGLAAIVIFTVSAKIGRKDRDREWFTCLGGYLSIVCALVEQRTKAKGMLEKLLSPHLKVVEKRK